MEGAILGAIIMIVISALSVLQKVKEKREDEEYRRRQASGRPSVDDLPEATRRMLYGDSAPMAEVEDDDEVEPIPVPRPRPAPRPTPRPQAAPPLPPRRPAAPPAPPQRPVVVQRQTPPRPPQAQPAPYTAQPQRQPVQRKSAEIHEQAYLQRAQAEVERRKKEAARIRQRDSARSHAAQRPVTARNVRNVMRNPHSVRLAVVLTEVLGPPKGMQ